MVRDGPLIRKAPLLVATGDKGSDSIMVRDTAARAVRDTPARPPKANLVRDEKGCKAMVARAARYIAAPFQPFPLPLDIRGTELQKRVWEEVRRISFGASSTDSMIAAAIGHPKAIRAVAQSCSRSRFSFAIPCHRVARRPAVRVGRVRGETRREAARVVGGGGGNSTHVRVSRYFL